MRVGVQTILLTGSGETGRIDFPAAPRNQLAPCRAPDSPDFPPFALPRFMKAYSFPVFRAIVLVIAVGLATSAAFGVTTAPVKHRKKRTSTAASPRAVNATVKPV